MSPAEWWEVEPMPEKEPELMPGLRKLPDGSWHMSEARMLWLASCLAEGCNCRPEGEPMQDHYVCCQQIEDLIDIFEPGHYRSIYSRRKETP